MSVLAVVTVRLRFDDPDMWWHLKTGEIVWTTHSIPMVDIFSYTAHGHAVVPQEWLSQTLIYLAYRLGGYSGLMLWLCVTAAALLVAGYALCSIVSGNAKVGFLGALTIWFFSTAGLAIRPQMIGYLLLIVELLVIHLGRTRNPRWLFALPPLFALWVNCHGSFFLGLIVGGMFLFSSFFEFRLGLLTASRWSARSRRLLALSLVFSLAAIWINPAGAAQIFYPLNAMVREPLVLRNIEEWLPLQLGSGRGIGFLVCLCLIFLLVIVRRSELLWHELILLAIGAWMGAEHRRLLFVFGILAAPTLTRLLASAWDNYDPAQDRPLANAALLAGSLLVAIWAFPSPASLQQQVDAGSPVEAVKFIESHHLPGRMFNDFAFGGYLIWAAPDHPVFVDGRADVFERTGILRDLEVWTSLESDPNSLLDKYNIGFCLLSRRSPMAQVLKLLPQWKPVYSDSVSIIFVRTHPEQAAPHDTRLQKKESDHA